MTTGGLVLGALGAFVFVAILNYVIQPQMSVETRDIYSVHGDRFDVWYHEGSPHRASYAELNALLEESLDDLLVRLDVAPSVMPSPIDVLVHDNSGQLQASIAQRKSPMGTHTFFAVLDLLAGEDPTPRLTELVLAFGWGECFSQLLYAGTLAVLIEPERNHHAALAAAPPSLQYSFGDLVRLEAAGEFEPTIYQRFDSPFSSSLALSSLEGIAAFYSVFAAGDGAIPEENFAVLQAASLVDYLVECNGGLTAIQEVWGPGSSEALFERLACGTLDELSAAWWAVAAERGAMGEQHDYYRALYLFESGDFAAAYRLTSGWESNDASHELLALAVRAALSVGEFEVAQAWVETAGPRIDQLTEWVALFEGWTRLEEEGLTILVASSDTDISSVLEEVRAASAEIASKLELEARRLPAQMTVFCYDDAEARRAGQGVTPNESSRQTAWHVVEGEDVAWVLASSLPAYAYGIASASNLLRTGIAAAITVPRADLMTAGCEILVDGNWPPLWQLGFGGVPPRLFQTQSGLMVLHLIDTHGLETIEEMWHATARLGGGRSFDSALLEFAGTSRREVEQELLNTVLVCD